MSSPTNASRMSRRTKANNSTAPAKEESDDNPSKTIQTLQDELEELTDVKERLDDKVTQLEERAQFLEADARLSASIAAKEMMDLKEKTRQLEIDLSLAVDERDLLAQEKSVLQSQLSDMEVLDEAKQLSVQLKEAWLRISTMKATQEETVKKLFKAEETNVKLTANVSKAEGLYSTTKSTLTDEQKRWRHQKQGYESEIDSLKEKLVASSPDGGAQVMDWEHDKKRMRDSIKHERAAWDREKKGLLDQIASLKIKTTTLHMQKAPPPEWVLEKHQLTDQCSTLQSRVAILESDRTVSSSQHKSQVAKLEKKIELLRVKLVEVMEHAQAVEAKAKEDAKQAVGAKKATTPRARRAKRTRNVKETDSEVESEADAGEQEAPPATPPRPVRSTRTKAPGGGFRSVNYHFDTHSSNEDTSQGEGEDEDDENDDEDDANEESGFQEAQEKADQSNVDRSAGTPEPSVDMEGVVGAGHDHVVQQEDQAGSPSKAGARRSISGRGRKAEDSDDFESSDSEFEPPKKVVSKGKSRPTTKKLTSPITETVTKKPGARRTKSTSKEAAGHDSNIKRKAAAAMETPLSPESMADTPTSTTSGASVSGPPTTAAPGTTTIAGLTPISTPSLTPGSSTAAKGGGQDTTQKIKKKRKLLTGKGLDELGDILNGAGMTASASPSKSLQFLPSKTKLQGGRSTLLSGNQPAAPKLEALNAIKMAFALPKARNPSPTRDAN
ncbi:hypothetical protein BGX29_001280 [Mortierella sp. GBA35]|nr:hypothetical protein BGX29_001280 [Mortierella sp. GBA35]